MNYNAPIGSDFDPRCPWLGNAGVSDMPIQSKCVFCGEYHDDEDCEIHAGLVFCKECVKAIEEDGDGMEEEVENLKSTILKNKNINCKY